MAMQFDLFAPSQPSAVPADVLQGLAIQLPDCCQCGSCDAVIGEGKGPHSASLFCSQCERHRGWMTNESHAFVSELIEKFGKPTAPIQIRRKKEGEQQ
jgi:hypothetical protein